MKPNAVVSAITITALAVLVYFQISNLEATKNLNTNLTTQVTALKTSIDEAKKAPEPAKPAVVVAPAATETAAVSETPVSKAVVKEIIEHQHARELAKEKVAAKDGPAILLGTLFHKSDIDAAKEEAAKNLTACESELTVCVKSVVGGKFAVLASSDDLDAAAAKKAAGCITKIIRKARPDDLAIVTKAKLYRSVECL